MRTSVNESPQACKGILEEKKKYVAFRCCLAAWLGRRGRWRGEGGARGQTVAAAGASPPAEERLAAP